MTAAPLATTPPVRAIAAAPRLAFIDNIRWTMIVLVISMHACVTYSPFGSWYYREPIPAGFATLVAFAAYQSFLQAFFMSLLFFVAGYFSAASYDRKGFSPFIRDRLFRLGLPTLLYMVAIGPLTQYYLAGSWGTGGFVYQWVTHARRDGLLSETGPMWFCAALLLFSIAYALLRLTRRREPALALTDGRGTDAAAALLVAVMAASTFAVRIVEPEGRAILNLQLGDFPQYVLMFAAGLLAGRGLWLAQLPDRLCRRWGAIALALGTPWFAALVVFGGAMQGHTARYDGGLNWVSAGKSLWEALVCVGVSLYLLGLFRGRFNRRGPVAGWMSDNAFAVYLIHPPILIALALLLRGLTVQPLAKAAVLTALTAAASFTIAAPLLRKTPFLRAIV